MNDSRPSEQSNNGLPATRVDARKVESPTDLPPQQAVQDSANTETNAESWRGRMPKIIAFDELARCGAEIWIENNGEIYRLRKTKQGKLILTK